MLLLEVGALSENVGIDLRYRSIHFLITAARPPPTAQNNGSHCIPIDFYIFEAARAPIPPHKNDELLWTPDPTARTIEHHLNFENCLYLALVPPVPPTPPPELQINENHVHSKN